MSGSEKLTDEKFFEMIANSKTFALLDDNASEEFKEWKARRAQTRTQIIELCKKWQEKYGTFRPYSEEYNDFYEGHTAMQPLSAEQIKLVESKHNIIIPELLKLFLLHGSSSTYQPYLKFQPIQLFKNIEFMYFPKEIELSSLIWSDQVNVETDSDLEDNDPEHPETLADRKQAHVTKTSIQILGLYKNGALKIRETGCGHGQWIILQGRHTGTIWEERFSGDGPMTFFQDSFLHFQCPSATLG